MQRERTFRLGHTGKGFLLFFRIRALTVIVVFFLVFDWCPSFLGRGLILSHVNDLSCSSLGLGLGAFQNPERGDHLTCHILGQSQGGELGRQLGVREGALQVFRRREL